MCGGPVNEKGAANYIREYLRCNGSRLQAQRDLVSWQRAYRWMVGWQIVDNKLLTPAQFEQKENDRLAVLAKRHAEEDAKRREAASKQIDAMFHEAGAMATIEPVAKKRRVVRSVA